MKPLITLLFLILTTACFSQGEPAPMAASKKIKVDTVVKDTTLGIILSPSEYKALMDFINTTSKAPHPEVPNVLLFIDSRKRILDIKPRQ